MLKNGYTLKRSGSLGTRLSRNYIIIYDHLLMMMIIVKGIAARTATNAETNAVAINGVRVPAGTGLMIVLCIIHTILQTLPVGLLVAALAPNAIMKIIDAAANIPERIRKIVHIVCLFLSCLMESAHD